MTEEIQDLFKNVSLKERDVVVLLFGLNGGIAKTPEEIAALYGVDKNEILQIAEQGLAKIPATVDDLKLLAQKAQEELKTKLAQKKQDTKPKKWDSELLNIDFSDNSEK